MNAPLLISRAAAAALSGLSVAQLDKLRKCGALAAVRLRRKHRYLRAQILALRTTSPDWEMAPCPTAAGRGSVARA